MLQLSVQFTSSLASDSPRQTRLPTPNGTNRSSRLSWPAESGGQFMNIFHLRDIRQKPSG